MSTVEKQALLESEFQAALERAMKGVRDPEIVRKTIERVDRRREDIQRKHGILDIGVPAIRNLRQLDA